MLIYGCLLIGTTLQHQREGRSLWVVESDALHRSTSFDPIRVWRGDRKPEARSWYLLRVELKFISFES
jgi:hypothetical protein